VIAGFAIFNRCPELTMADLPPADSLPDAPRFTLRAFLFREWPYLLMLALAVFGVAYSSVSQTAVRGYWIALGPFIGLVCILTGWPDAGSGEARFRLVWTQALHWCAVLLAIELMFVGNVDRMMNADASALSALTLLALGTFTAGVHIGAWRVCLVGIVLALGVPGIAWLEKSALLILLVVVALVAIAVPIVWMTYSHRWRRA
jgi:hypothetical protein